MSVINVETTHRNQMVDITAKAARLIPANMRNGICVLMSMHTTAALTVNECADPDVQRDMEQFFEVLLAKNSIPWRHSEGNSDSHVKTSMLGPSLTLIIEDGKFCLGTWQGIYLCEFDGPRRRNIAVQFVSAFDCG